ncbi:MAG: cupin domain-containing protein [Rhodobacteraceae bacterium]|jgi:quercetin dioxygenase-like cupin family protein|nr:cupin domain-containing protein [Paracoccaceae bacterium]
MKTSFYNPALVATTALGLGALVLLSVPGSAHDGELHHTAAPVEDITFAPGPATLPEGAEFAVLHGNPAEPGPFVMRLKFPAGYEIPPHLHPEDEIVTVISGGFGMGAGEALDRAEAPILAPGSFVHLPAGMAHFAWTKEETVVQINAVGPFGITYVDPADDPRGTN